MFKTDEGSLADLSFAFDPQTLANIHGVLTYLQRNDLSELTREQMDTALRGLERIGRLQLEGKIYGFHVLDTYAEDRGSNPEGVELYLRRGDLLRDWFVPPVRDYVNTVEKATEALIQADIARVYTGELPFDTGFLGLRQEMDEDTPVTLTPLEDTEIAELESRGIEVVTLDTLI